jgi:type II secretory pathway component PulC
MINKFKDFLKKISRKNTEDFSDQEEVSDEDDRNNVSSQADETLVTSLSLKDKFTQSFTGLRLKLTKSKIGQWKLPEGMRNKNKENILSLSPNISRSIEKLLSREARDTIHQISLVLIISLFTYTLGKTTALILKGATVVNSAKNYNAEIDLSEDFNVGSISQVRSVNLFRTNTGLSKKKKVADTKCEQAQQASNLPIKIINTVVLQDSVKSLASVQIRGERTIQEVREGEQISNLAKIFKISRLEMIVKNLENDMCESIISEKGRESVQSQFTVMSPAESRAFKANRKLPGIENVGNNFSISKALLDEKIKDIAAVLSQARAIKIQNPDGSMAFKLTELDPQGIFPYLGLQDQDIITSINGKPIYDMNEVMGLFAKIKNLDKLQLGIRREGTDSNLDYNIKK